MNNKNNITYQHVAACCNDIIKSGDKPSVRRINKILGGSFSTISEFLQRWQEQQALARSVDSDLSDEFRQAVLAEFARITAQVKDVFKAQLLEKTGQLSESQELLAEYEANLELLKQQVAQTQECATQEQLRLEKALAAAAAKVEVSTNRAQELQEELDSMRDKCHQAELKAAISETRANELEKRIALLESSSTVN